MDRLYEESETGFGLKFWVSCALTFVAVALYLPFLAWLLLPDRFPALAILNEKPLYGVPLAAALPIVWVLLMAKFQEFPRFVLTAIPGPGQLFLGSFFFTALFFVVYTDFFFTDSTVLTDGTGLAISEMKPGFMLYVPTMISALLFHFLVTFGLLLLGRRREWLISRRLMIFK